MSNFFGHIVVWFLLLATVMGIGVFVALLPQIIRNYKLVGRFCIVSPLGEKKEKKCPTDL